MALACLCAKAKFPSKDRPLLFTAFVVDHQLRSESDEEAHKVVRNLTHMGERLAKNLT